MKKVLQKVTLAILAIAILVAGGNILMNTAEASTAPHRFRVVVGGNTYVRRTANGANQGHIRQNANFDLPPSGDMRIVGNWTWILGGISGNATQTNGFNGEIMFVSTSQLGWISGGRNASCTITANGNTYVRHTPGGLNQGVIFRNATFRPSGFRLERAGGWTWHLGTIGGNAAQTNGWAGRTMWVATSQLSNTTVCQHGF